jgi:hypothetical protein
MQQLRATKPPQQEQQEAQQEQQEALPVVAKIVWPPAFADLLPQSILPYQRQQHQPWTPYCCWDCSVSQVIQKIAHIHAVIITGSVSIVA